MAAVHIRNVPEETVARLKQRAAANGRSLEAELRRVLDAEALAPVTRERRQINWPDAPAAGYSDVWDRAEIYPGLDERA